MELVLNTFWLLFASALVFFMQAGFAMVESGFTSSRISSNIMMKNLADFSIGSLVFWLFGYSIMYGDSIGGFIGWSGFATFEDETASGGFDYASLMFQTVFAATAATIVSGAVAGRAKFSAYLIFSFLITAIIYPISGHWKWGGGWLDALGFQDFAGSTIVHSVGGWAGLIGALILGPRIGKYGEDGKARALPGHNLTMGALGTFILWLGWFGFNPGSQLALSSKEDADAVALIFVTTNLAAAGGAITALFVSWAKYKKPDLSLSLNGALAGLVGITAGCDAVTPGGAILIGSICGLVLIFSVSFFDNILKIDDPVGAISVHGVCGAVGTLLLGFFSVSGGILYGHGFDLLVSQLIGVLAVGIWTLVSAFIFFKIIDMVMGLRVAENVEREGIDVHEHGVKSYNF